MGTHPIFESDFDCLTEQFKSKRRPMDNKYYAAYLKAFKAELENPTERPAHPFGQTPSAGGPGAKGSSGSPSVEEKARMDLHAVHNNVGDMSRDEKIEKIFSGLKKVGEHIAEKENDFIAEELGGLTFGNKLSIDGAFRISSIFSKVNVGQVTKTIFLGLTLGYFADNEDDLLASGVIQNLVGTQV